MTTGPNYKYNEYTSTENISVIEEESDGFRLLFPPPLERYVVELAKKQSKSP
jgi:hypothetical protein